MGGTWPWASPGMADAMAREDYREAREDEARQIARAEAEDARVAAAEHAARMFEYQHGYSQAEHRQALAEFAVAREQRRAGAEYGSAQRAAVFIDGVPLAPRETAGAAASRQAEDERLIEEARRSSQDPFMRDQVRRLEQRRGREVSRSAVPFASRALGDGRFDVPQCPECVRAGATAEESFLIHSDPQAPASVSGARQAATGYREISR
jgi:hypothetical protein